MQFIMYNVTAMITMTFKGGVHPPEHKEITVDKKIKKVEAPDIIVLPLTQHIGAPNEPLVKVGDQVKVGQKIAEARAFVSAPVHSSVSGKVKSIEKYFHPVIGKSQAIIIENDKKYETIEFKKIDNVDTLKKEEIVSIIKDSGLVGLGGATFPTHVKLSVPEGKTIDTLVINGAECEPYLTCDHRIMIEKTEEVLKGINIASRALGVKNVFLAIEENKLSAVFTVEKVLQKLNKKFGNTPIKVIVLETKYPQGGEKQLIKAILKREVPPGKLPLDVGVVVQNVGTCFAIYEAVYEGKPLIERALTITGSCVKNSGNFSVRLGTPLREVVNHCGGFTEEPAKIISGGPMMGIAQYSLDIPIIKGTAGIVFLSKKEVEVAEETPCIRCAKCVDVCPVNLTPTDIMRMVKHSRWHYLDTLYPTDCMECGSCTYMCPSRIPLVQYIKLAKIKAMEKK